MASSTIVTAGLGFVFWILASRIYTDDSNFGVGATAVSTMMMLADLACVGMRTGLVKFVPALGSMRRVVIVQSYLIATGVAASVALTFLLGLNLWAPKLGALTDTVLIGLFFVAATACWSIFILEDSVLTGIRKTVWVPIENAVFGLAKIALLWPMSKVSPDLGVFLAWALPVFPIVIGVNTLIARHVPDQTPAEPEPEPSAPARSSRPATSGLRELLSYSSADWLASVARLAATGIGPLLVLGIIGQAGAGYFNIGWLIAYTTYLLSINVSDAMLAESSFDQADLNDNSRQALLLSLTLTIPVVAVGTLAAPYILQIFGQTFADNATGLLRLLLLAALPAVAYQIFLGRLRSQGRMRTVIGLETTLAVLVVGIGTVALRTRGLAGIGLAWLLAFGLLGLLALLLETQWWWASRLDTSLVRSVGSQVGRFRRDRVPGELAQRLEAAIGGAGVTPTGEPSWTALGPDIRRARIDDADDVHDVYLAKSAAGTEELDRSHRVLQVLAGSPHLEALKPLLPICRSFHNDEAGGSLVISRPSGPTATTYLSGVEPSTTTAPLDFVERTMIPIEDLHRATEQRRVATPAELSAWIDEPLDGVRLRGRATRLELSRIDETLRGELSGELVISQVHGALIPGNVIVDRRTGEPRCIRGWRETSQAPAAVDRATLALTTQALVEGEELGVIVRRALLDPDHDAVVRLIGSAPDPVSIRGVVLLAWLLLVGRDRPSGSAVLPNLFWASRNVQPVVAAVAEVMEVR